jgi:preprotein translocase subunit Sec63
MTEVEAKQIIGISDSAGFAEAKQVCEDMLQELRLKMLPGNTMAKRVEAERKISQIITAWEVLNKTYSAGGYPQPVPQYTQVPTAMPSAVFGSLSTQRQVQIAGILVTTVLGLVVIAFIISSNSSYK